MRVLAAVDFSHASDLVVEHAKAAIQREAETSCLALCHVVPLMHETSTLFPEEHQAAILQLLSVEHELKQVIHNRMLAMLAGDPGEVFIEQGNPHSECIRRADSWRADLIVVGNHSKSGFEHAFLGSTAERITRYAHCSVLVARPTPKPTSSVVLAATDLSDPSLPSLRAAANEAHRRGARLVVLTVVDWSGAGWMAAAGAPFGIAPALASADLQRDSHRLLLETLSQALQHIGAVGEPRVIEGSAASSIVACAKELNAELVVVGTHGRTGLARLALGSVAETVIQTCPCPVLAVRMAKAE